MKTGILYPLILISLFLGMQSCIEDGFDTSPSAQPVFSVDTLDMGWTFTGQSTPTHRFTVHNRNSKLINISSIRLADETMNGMFRLNVDGFSGREFTDVEIRPNDSIYVFVEATLEPNATPTLTDVTARLNFLTNGVESSVILLARGQNVERRSAYTVTSDEVWDATIPWQIFDSLTVAPGATLTLRPGVSMHFHDGAKMKVYGSLVTEGTPEAPVTFGGDRTYNVVGDIPFDLMASQWLGLKFCADSRGNRLSHTVIKNTVAGVQADDGSEVTMLNCRLRNSSTVPLSTRNADITLIGTEVAEGSAGLFEMEGGNITANHCTFANYYLFTAISGAALKFIHTEEGDLLPGLKADFMNCIIYGLGGDLSEGDLTGTGVTLRNCVLKSEGSDDDNFINCIWDTDPVYATVRSDYYFDYRLKSESPVIGAADPSLTLPEAAEDFYGTPRLPAPSPGAYQAIFEEE